MFKLPFATGCYPLLLFGQGVAGWSGCYFWLLLRLIVASVTGYYISESGQYWLQLQWLPHSGVTGCYWLFQLLLLNQIRTQF